MISSKKIEIYVSNRIDKESKQIPNSMYVPVRCGACYDSREEIAMLGDDTGDNISKYRNNLCELTVLYWAWKNSKADYIGLSHYRRFLSFANEKINEGHLKLGYLDNMSDTNLELAGLLDEQLMRQIIESCDLLVAENYDIHKDAKVSKNIKSVYDFWLTLCPEFISKDNFQIMFDEIRDSYPDYYDDAIELRNGKKFLGFNCCIGKKEVVDDLCEFLFGVIFKVMKKIKQNDNYSEQNLRTPGYMCEWLFSIWCYHVEKNKKYDVRKTQLLAFHDTDVQEELEPVKGAVPIVYKASHENIPEIAVAIQSLIDHSLENGKIDIILLMESRMCGDEFTCAENMLLERLHRQVSRFENISLRVFNPKEKIGKLERRSLKEPSVKKEYYNILLPWILEKYEKVIVLHHSTIVLNEIKSLYDLDLDNKMVGACSDVYYMDVELKNPNCDHGKIKYVDNPYDYVNTDVLLMNLAAIRKNYNKEDIIDYCLTENRSGNEIYNHFYEKHIQKIDFKWNYYGIQDEFFNIMLRDSIPLPVKNSYKSVKEPHVVNMRVEGRVLPLVESPAWILFWECARKTAFYELLIGKYCNSIQPGGGGSFARRIADKMFPKGTMKREVLKKIIPRNSIQWNFLKKFYHAIALD